MHPNFVEYDAFLRPKSTIFCAGKLCPMFKGLCDVDQTAVLCGLRQKYLDATEIEEYPARSCMLPLVYSQLSAMLQQRRQTEIKDVHEAVQRRALDREYDEWEQLPEELAHMAVIIKMNSDRVNAPQEPDEEQQDE